MNNLVLVVDDSITVCKIIEVCLSREGYEVKCFPDGIQALQWFRQPYARIPDLFLVDLILPKLDGYALIRILHAQPAFKKVPIVLMSRRNGPVDKLKGRLVGAVTYLVKPLTTHELIAVAGTYINVPVSARPF